MNSNPPIITTETDDAHESRVLDRSSEPNNNSSGSSDEAITNNTLIEKKDDPMEEDPPSPATVFKIRLRQHRSNLRHKMSVPELCRNFRLLNFLISFLSFGVEVEVVVPVLRFVVFWGFGVMFVLVAGSFQIGVYHCRPFDVWSCCCVLELGLGVIL